MRQAIHFTNETQSTFFTRLSRPTRVVLLRPSATLSLLHYIWPNHQSCLSLVFNSFDKVNFVQFGQLTKTLNGIDDIKMSKNFFNQPFQEKLI